MEYVDTETLESLVDHAEERSDADVTVQFDYDGYIGDVSEDRVAVLEDESLPQS
ncbi:HalOD1 output domain-containing protein [Halorarius halobius]|uniref:HalOD1 output domain-containing protein n=1 Tax=Halorarius halobius TaxID=2962671 RepID=UPI0020CDB0CA|nr:HalOD1 output domain-containing protein [Halorarius halobius]